MVTKNQITEITVKNVITTEGQEEILEKIEIITEEMIVLKIEIITEEIGEMKETLVSKIEEMMETPVSIEIIMNHHQEEIETEMTMEEMKLEEVVVHVNMIEETETKISREEEAPEIIDDS